ncbi:DUF7535 family protein [Natrinema marinum]|uniref:DUF7535 family protein n=1 Tax=Natrinema marinum TaxID=2961598 RepID=UPI0020C8FAEA|nr:hypothetical protein [Natrinema marinum]
MSVKVSESTGYGPNTQMSLFGYVMAAILVIMLLPLLPVLIPAWILWKVFVSDEDNEHSFENWRRETGHTGSSRLEAEETEADETEPDDAESADAETDQTAAES